MPHVNRYGGRPELVKTAVGALDDAGGADPFLERLSRYAADATAVPLRRGGTRRKPRQSGWTGAFTSGRFGLSARRTGSRWRWRCTRRRS
jgi:hypothetical protein